MVNPLVRASTAASLVVIHKLVKWTTDTTVIRLMVCHRFKMAPFVLISEIISKKKNVATRCRNGTLIICNAPSFPILLLAPCLINPNVVAKTAANMELVLCFARMRTRVSAAHCFVLQTTSQTRFVHFARISENRCFVVVCTIPRASRTDKGR